MKAKHLPVYGIGPVLCVPLAVVMGIVFTLSIKGKIPSTDFGEMVNSILSIMGYIIILLGIFLCLGADKGNKLKSNIKEKISSISEEMKILRKEISLCESIAERSEIISPKLQQIHAEESEQTKRGKEKAYEPWR